MERYELEREEDGREAVRVPYRGHRLIAHNLHNRGTAFTEEERRALGLSGMLPNQVRVIADQAVRAYGHVCEMGDSPLERYVALADLEARNAILYYRVLVEHLEEMLPIVYTPTVGEACQKFSHLFRRGRGLWITPDHQGRVAEVLRNAPYEGVRLIVATDNERILGLGDQGAGGMGIPVGKLDLYTVGAGIHPSQALPISLDVGTDNEELRGDPYYVGWRGARLRGDRYDALVEEFVEAIGEVFPGALLQWEDFKKANAFRLLDRYRDRILSFNDDIQGTAGIALAGVVAASRVTGTPMERQRVVMLGAGAAGVGIARILRAELEQLGVTGDALIERIALLDSKGLLTARRDYRAAYKQEFAWPTRLVAEAGLDPDGDNDLLDVVKALKPTVLIGTSGHPGTFTEEVVRAMAEHAERPAIFPFSNPNSKAEADPADLVRWTDGRALIATGSPFDPVEHDGKTIHVAQGNNVYVFPGVGLGALASRAEKVLDSFFAVAAHAIGERVDDAAIRRGQLYPPLGDLRAISRDVALAVARHAVEAGVAPKASRDELEARVDEMMWFPEYPRIQL
ncbi:MAG: NAD-dependent malic enzyme [Myxococcota bacterium]|nr:NAD-dependent malic enzyme [Myxococcota bacterium]